MKITGFMATIENTAGIRPRSDSMIIIEDSGFSIDIPNSVILRCYSIMECEAKRIGKDWDKEQERILTLSMEQK